jgi:branched-chain amino acid transport system ATP-binding protein
MLTIDNLQKRFGGLTVTDGVDLALVPGELHALIGPNGAGKTTLINQLAGEIRPDAGRILLDGVEISRLPPWRRSLLGLGRSFQISSVFADFTALENVVLAVQARQGHSFRFWRAADSYQPVVARARAALADAGLAAMADEPVARLSHGEMRQLELAMTLAGEPRLLLLDEPMAGMSPSDSHKVIAALRGLKRRYTTVLVEHDMDAVFALADRISVLFYGKILVTGTVEDIRSNPVVRDAYLGHDPRSTS